MDFNQRMKTVFYEEDLILAMNLLYKSRGINSEFTANDLLKITREKYLFLDFLPITEFPVEESDLENFTSSVIMLNQFTNPKNTSAIVIFLTNVSVPVLVKYIDLAFVKLNKKDQKIVNEFIVVQKGTKKRIIKKGKYTDSFTKLQKLFLDILQNDLNLGKIKGKNRFTRETYFSRPVQLGLPCVCHRLLEEFNVPQYDFKSGSHYYWKYKLGDLLDAFDTNQHGNIKPSKNQKPTHRYFNIFKKLYGFE